MKHSLKLSARNPWILFVGLALLFLAMRLLPIFTAVERISHYDELDIGMIAKEWLRGTLLPLWHYQIDPYGGESLVLAALALPLVKFFGSTLWIVKLPSLFFSLTTFSVTYLFLLRFFGSPSAIWGSLLLIFCPPSFVQFSLSALSGHTEVLFLNITSLYFFYNALFVSRKKISLFLFGIFSGLGFWFYQESGILTLACLISWPFINKKSLLSKDTLFFIAGTVLGLMPLVAYTQYASSYSFSFFSINPTLLLRNVLSAKELVAKPLALWTETLPVSFAFFPVSGIHERVFSVFYFLGLFLPLGILLGKILTERKDSSFEMKKTIPLMLYPVAFSACYVFSSFSAAHDIGYIGFRYLSPLHFFTLLLTAVLFSKFKTRYVILAPLLLLGLWGQTSLMLKEPLGQALRFKGDSFFRVGTQWHYSLFSVIQSAKDLGDEMARRPPSDAFYLLWGLTDAAMGNPANSLLAEETRLIPFEQMAPLSLSSANPYIYEWLGVLRAADSSTFETLIQKLPKPLYPYAEKGFSEEWFSLNYKDILQCPDCVKTFQVHSRWFYFELGKNYFFKLESNPTAYNFLGDLNRSEIKKTIEHIRSLPFSENKKDLIFSGLAMGHQRTSWDSNTLFTRSVQSFLSLLTPEEQRSFYWGLGWMVRSIHREDQIRGLAWLETFPSKMLGQGLDGFRAFEKWYEIPV